MLRSDLRDYSDVYFVLKGTITVEVDNDVKTGNNNNTFIDNAEDLDIVMPIYNLLEYSDNYSMTSGSLWNYYRDEVNDSAIENPNINNRIYNNETITSSSLKIRQSWYGAHQMIIINQK